MSPFEIGMRVGRQWSRGFGRTEEINRVVSLAHRRRFFEPRPFDGLTVPERLALAALGDQGQLTARDARAFWQWLELVSDRAERLLEEPDFARGFATGVYLATTRQAA